MRGVEETKCPKYKQLNINNYDEKNQIIGRNLTRSENV